MENFVSLLKKYELILSADRQFIVNPRNDKKIFCHWDDIQTSILMIENLHPDVNGEKEILDVLEEQINSLLT
jgi:hypothetical protein